MPFKMTALLSRLLDLAGADSETRADSILASFVHDDYVRLPNGREVGVLVKPPPKRLVDALVNSSSRRMVGLLHGGEMIWWEASAATSAEMARFYAFIDVRSNRFHATLSGHEVHVEYDEEFWDYATLKRRLQLRQLTESVDMYFHVDNLGWVAGPEWVEIMEDEIGMQWMNVQRTRPTANIMESSPARTPASKESEVLDTNMSPLSLLITMRS